MEENNRTSREDRNKIIAIIVVAVVILISVKIIIGINYLEAKKNEIVIAYRKNIDTKNPAEKLEDEELIILKDGEFGWYFLPRFSVHRYHNRYEVRTKVKFIVADVEIQGRAFTTFFVNEENKQDMLNLTMKIPEKILQKRLKKRHNDFINFQIRNNIGLFHEDWLEDIPPDEYGIKGRVLFLNSHC